MKTNVVEYGTVIERKGAMARVVLDKGTTCRKCGMAALGMCRPGGSGLIVDVEDPVGTKTGDRVKLGLKKTVHLRGYILAFILPLAGFVLGAFGGYAYGQITGVNSLEVPAGLVGLGVAGYYGLRALRRMDTTERLHIEKVVSGAGGGPSYGEPYSSEGADYLQRFTS